MWWCGIVPKSCLTLAIPWTVACQAPLSIGFSRQEYWSGLTFPSPGDLPEPAIKPGSPALQADSLPTELWGKPPTECRRNYGYLWVPVKDDFMFSIFNFLFPFKPVILACLNWLTRDSYSYLLSSQLCLTLWLHGQQHTRLTLSFIIFWSLLRLMSIESVMLSNHLILSCLLLLLSVFPSIRVFTNE